MLTNFNQALWDKILAIDLTRINQRLVHKLGFKEDRAEAAIYAYRQYMYLINTVGNLTPDHDVDEVWHAHVLHLPSYFRDCMFTFGKVIWHIPKPIVDGKVICSGICNAGGDSNDYKQAAGADILSFSIAVPVDEYAHQFDQPAPDYQQYAQEHFA
jgi:hypothetical protein